MRGATECAKRLKLFYSALRSKLGKVPALTVGNPISQMILGILSRDTPENEANAGLDRLRAIVVDYNELRVIPAIELAEILRDFPDARLKCEDIARSLNAVFAMEHTVALDHLMELSRRETLAYLEGIDGLEAYTVARVRLLGLRQHAIPLDEAMWAVAREEEIVNPRCPLGEAQQFLERQIAPEHAHEFVALLKKHAWSEKAAAVRKGEVERITSVPPDRSTRNMLQMVSMGGSVSAGGAGEDERVETGAAATSPASHPPSPTSAANASKQRSKSGSKSKPRRKSRAKAAAKAAARRSRVAPRAAKPRAATKEAAHKTATSKSGKTSATGKPRVRSSTTRKKARRTGQRNKRARSA